MFHVKHSIKQCETEKRSPTPVKSLKDLKNTKTVLKNAQKAFQTA